MTEEKNGPTLEDLLKAHEGQRSQVSSHCVGKDGKHYVITVVSVDEIWIKQEIILHSVKTGTNKVN